MDWDEVEIIKVAANGIEFEIAAMGEGDKLALCLHGFPEHAYSWRFQMPFLARQGYRVWAPNLRGYGGTTAPRNISAYKLPILVEDVLSLIAVSGTRETLLIGHDWGALLAWTVAMDHPDRIVRLVILNAPHPARFKAEFFRSGQFLRSWYLFFVQLPILPEMLLARLDAKTIGNIILRNFEHPELISTYDLDIYRQNASRPGRLTAMLNWYRALFRYGGLLKRPFPIIEAPVLLIWGDADFALNVWTALGTEQYARNLTFRRLEGISHWVQQEAPDAVNAMLEAWLAGITVPKYREIVESIQPIG